LQTLSKKEKCNIYLDAMEQHYKYKDAESRKSEILRLLQVDGNNDINLQEQNQIGQQRV
jgi:hypothetical protein